MKIAVGSDHGGFEFKQLITDFLHGLGLTVEDVGCYSLDSVDYPDFADQVCLKVQ
ncbi:MAG: ribose-5-phosphate isomerase, partial [Desulfobulbus sp.]